MLFSPDCKAQATEPLITDHQGQEKMGAPDQEERRQPCAPCVFLFYLGPLSFLLGEPDQRFIDFVYPFRKPVLGFIDCFLLFFNLCYLFPLRSLLFPSIN